jgi:hypothetical protein
MGRREGSEPRPADRAPASPARFDAAYYRRFYGAANTRIQGAKEVARLGAALVAMIQWYGGRVGSALEIGAGSGLLRDWFAANHPKVRYVSTELSAYAAARFGHVQRDITAWRGRQRFDLVVCQGVLPYLSDDGARAAMENLAAMSHGFLYIEAITRRDYETACDREKTDPSMRLRTRAFYRRALSRHFRPLGGGLFYARRGPLVFWELEEG